MRAARPARSCPRRSGAAFGAAAHFAAGRMRGLHAVAAVQHLVAEMRGEIELQARGSDCRARLR